jgi:hypothetical protein
MENSKEKKSEIERAGEDLFDFVVDREDIKWLMSHLPEAADVQRETVEYELQILKIISVGWSISYYLETSPHKNQLLEVYWKAVYDFSQTISTATANLIGHDIDYFQILKDRLDMYVDVLAQNPGVTEPAVVIGPEFARTCGNAEDIFTFMTGSKMFITAINRTKEYLEAVEIR